MKKKNFKTGGTESTTQWPPDWRKYFQDRGTQRTGFGYGYGNFDAQDQTSAYPLLRFSRGKKINRKDGSLIGNLTVGGLPKKGFAISGDLDWKGTPNINHGVGTLADVGIKSFYEQTPAKKLAGFNIDTGLKWQLGNTPNYQAVGNRGGLKDGYYSIGPSARFGFHKDFQNWNNPYGAGNAENPDLSQDSLQNRKWYEDMGINAGVGLDFESRFRLPRTKIGGGKFSPEFFAEADIFANLLQSAHTSANEEEVAAAGNQQAASNPGGFSFGSNWKPQILGSARVGATWYPGRTNWPSRPVDDYETEYVGKKYYELAGEKDDTDDSTNIQEQTATTDFDLTDSIIPVEIDKMENLEKTPKVKLGKKKFGFKRKPVVPEMSRHPRWLKSGGALDFNTNAMGTLKNPKGCPCANGSVSQACCSQDYEEFDRGVYKEKFDESGKKIARADREAGFRGSNKKLPFRHRQTLKNANVNYSQQVTGTDRGTDSSLLADSNMSQNYANIDISQYTPEQQKLMQGGLWANDPKMWAKMNPGILNKKDLKQLSKVSKALNWAPPARETNYIISDKDRERNPGLSDRGIIANLEREKKGKLPKTIDFDRDLFGWLKTRIDPRLEPMQYKPKVVRQSGPFQGSSRWILDEDRGRPKIKNYKSNKFGGIMKKENINPMRGLNQFFNTGGILNPSGTNMAEPGFGQNMFQTKAPQMRTGGAMPMKQLTEFNEGGRHEENSLGGIPQGMNPEGQMNLVEEGETKFDAENYIFSDTLKVDKELAKAFNLNPKMVGKTFADASKIASRTNSKREGDIIEDAVITKDLENLMMAQEAFKQKEIEELLLKINELDPNVIPALMQQGQPQGDPAMEGQMQEAPMDEQAMMEQQMMEEQMMAEQQAGGGQPSPEEMAMMQQQQNMAMGQQEGMMRSGGKLPKEVLKARVQSHMSPSEADAYVQNYAGGGYMENSYDRGGRLMKRADRKMRQFEALSDKSLVQMKKDNEKYDKSGDYMKSYKKSMKTKAKSLKNLAKANKLEEKANAFFDKNSIYPHTMNNGGMLTTDPPFKIGSTSYTMDPIPNTTPTPQEAQYMTLRTGPSGKRSSSAGPMKYFNEAKATLSPNEFQTYKQNLAIGNPGLGMRSGGKMCYGCGGAMHNYGGRIDTDYKDGGFMKVAGNVLSRAADYIPIPGVNTALGFVGGSMSKAGELKSEGINPFGDGNFRDVLVHGGVEGLTSTLGPVNMAPGVGSAIGAGSDFLLNQYDQNLSGSRDDQEELAKILNDPTHAQYEHEVKRAQERSQNNKTADMINMGIGVADMALGKFKPENIEEGMEGVTDSVIEGMPQIDLPNNFARYGKKLYKTGGKQMIKRADGSYSQRGLWDNIRDNAGSGKKPTKGMLEQEKKINASSNELGGRMYYPGGFMNVTGGGPKDDTYGSDMTDGRIDLELGTNPANFISPIYNIGMGLFGKPADTSYTLDEFTAVEMDRAAQREAIAREAAGARNQLNRTGNASPSNILAIMSKNSQIKGQFEEQAENIDKNRKQAAKDKNTAAENAYKKEQAILKLQATAAQDKLIQQGLEDIAAIANQEQQNEMMYKFMQAMNPDVVAEGSYKNLFKFFKNAKRKGKKDKK